VPLAWRDPETDAALAGALASAQGRGPLVLLRTCDRPWLEVSARLRAGDPPSGLSVTPQVLAHLLQWRPPRSRRGLVVLFTGLSGSGKSTLARSLTEFVRHRTRRTVTLLDGDHVRRLLSSELGFDAADRDLNVRRIGFVAAEVARHGGLAVCAPIAPYTRSRAAVRAMVEPVGDLVVVHVATPLEVCEQRDAKGLYARARAGLVPGMTGIGDAYEPPADADVVVDTSRLDRAAALQLVLDHLVAGGWLVTDAATDRWPDPPAPAGSLGRPRDVAPLDHGPDRKA
jgi:sulfate adenylyltransferase